MPRGPGRGAFAGPRWSKPLRTGGRRASGTTSGSGSPLGSVTTGRCGALVGGCGPSGGGGGGSSAESQLTSGPSMRMRSGSRWVSTRARSTSGGEPISAVSVSV